MKRLAAPKVSAAQRAAARRGGGSGGGGSGGKGGVAADTRSEEEKRNFDSVTECCDKLMGANVTDVYQMTR